MPEHWKQMNSPRLIDAHAFCATAIPSAREHNRVSLVGRMRNAVTEQSDTRKYGRRVRGRRQNIAPNKSHAHKRVHAARSQKMGGFAGSA